MDPEQSPGRGGQLLGAWWVLPIGLLISVAMLIIAGLRPFGYSMAATAGLAALVRLVIPSDRAGGLVVRSRTRDVLLLLSLAAAMAALSVSLVIR